jgi:hypothetical protein
MRPLAPSYSLHTVLLKVDSYNGGAQALHVGSIASDCAADDSAEGPQEDNLWNDEQDYFVVGPVFFTIIVITAALLWFVATDTFQHRRRHHHHAGAHDAACQQSAVDELLRPPSLWRRLSCRGMTAEEQAHRSMLKNVGNSDDIKIVASMLKSRHITMARTSDAVKPDSPLSIADVPMLIVLLQEAASRQRQAKAAPDGGDRSVSEVIAGHVGLTAAESMGASMGALRFRGRMMKTLAAKAGPQPAGARGEGGPPARDAPRPRLLGGAGGPPGAARSPPPPRAAMTGPNI